MYLSHSVGDFTHMSTTKLTIIWFSTHPPAFTHTLPNVCVLKDLKTISNVIVFAIPYSSLTKLQTN